MKVILVLLLCLGLCSCHVQGHTVKQEVLDEIKGFGGGVG